MHKISMLIFGLMAILNTYAQSNSEIIPVAGDSIPSGPIIFSVPSATDYIQKLLDSDKLWRSDNEPMIRLLNRLLDHSHEPFDSVENRLVKFNPEEISINYHDRILYDTLPVRWLNDSTFIIDTTSFEKDPVTVNKTIQSYVIDISTIFFDDQLPDMRILIDSLLQAHDTIIEITIDTALLKTRNIKLYQFTNGQVHPSVTAPGSNRSAWLHTDSARLIFSETVKVLKANPDSPFNIVSDKRMPDSLQVAIGTLLLYTGHRDSTLLMFNDIYGHKTPFWVTSGKEELYRYWVKNYKNDSITIWVGNPARKEISFILEDDIDVNRITKEKIDDVPIISLEPDRTLAKIELLNEIPVYWDYELSNTFALNQTYLSNWARGGENSFSSMLDILGSARYVNKDDKTVWTNSGRLKFGTIITEEHGLRTNTDLLELNSQWNKVMKDKIDLSAVFYMKSQVARGYKYPNDSVVVSKFLNPATLTIGLGMEFKPFKNTSFNFSPISYKNTFVIDTANIDQTAHGIPENKQARQEMGAQLVFKNRLTLLKDLSISNAIRLFSNYLNKPQNIDVDWEINLDKKISWYFSVRLNLHMIYDDDIRFPVLDENKEPVYLPDGSIRKSPKMQFKEFLGLTLQFKF
ncbi:MAG TPA: DUF3078 domain-containing protein [Bacteroidaceae bacterium]|nr:DUF3078 domain-containing protein [Bacteroidaceae bacterium]